MLRCRECREPKPNTQICSKCDGVFCESHIPSKSHDCESYAAPDMIESTNTGNQAHGAQNVSSRQQHPEVGQPSSNGNSSSGGRLIAGAILLSVGALISITGFGVVIGVPLGMLGFAVMFPRFTTSIIVLAVLTFILIGLT
jgi:hypothetical protein